MRATASPRTCPRRGRFPRPRMELPSDATPADKMAHYARTIPEALSEMDEKQGATQQVIQWCESEYRTGDKRRVMTMTREYLTDALVSITTDVGSIAHQITASLDAQVKHFGVDQRRALSPDRPSPAPRPPLPPRALPPHAP